ncbi:Ribosomal protein L10e [Giardia muris]|uniref:Ribosomal protein L10e n=1 Tax=Giardia muris TaxID=5742 RepID=A0A4Z1SRE9_GIAMU|nr:Ribosomal protein L10e [Giardia muris]|eukprot:TNJ28436.1 Ribosomal protein L10e [Giardia muris]
MISVSRLRQALHLAVLHGQKHPITAPGAKNDLFAEQQHLFYVHLSIRMHNITPTPHPLPKPVRLPCPTVPAGYTIAAIVPEAIKDSVAENPVFDHIYTFEEIVRNRYTFEARRRIAHAYDLFVCPVETYPRLLKVGGDSIVKHTIVTYVSEPLHTLSRNDILRTVSFIDPPGAMRSMRLGMFGAVDDPNSTVENLFENAKELIGALDAIIPGGLRNCQCLLIDLAPKNKFPSLPLYNSYLPPNTRIFDPAPVTTRDLYDTAIDELYLEMEGLGVVDDEALDALHQNPKYKHLAPRKRSDEEQPDTHKEEDGEGSEGSSDDDDGVRKT